MFARVSVKGVCAVLAVGTFGALAGWPAPASAQGVSEWGMWDGPRRMHPAPDASRRDDNGYDSQPDDQPDDNYEAPDDRPYEGRRFDDGRDSRERRFGRHENRDYDDPGDGRGYDGPGNHRGNDPREFDDRDNDDEPGSATPEPDDRAEQGTAPGAAPGVDGGPRPVIQPAPPPVIAFRGPYAPGSVVIDTGGRKLYFVIGPATAYAYPIGVGREGFAWTGSEKISRITDWPDWLPPPEMRQRKPELPERMLGGIRNPLGAKAIYLGNTLYRIHGTNDPKSIGKAESSGCFRMLNAHVLHLASLVGIGTRVTVVHALNHGLVAQSASPRSGWGQRPRTHWEQRPFEPYPPDEPYPDDMR